MNKTLPKYPRILAIAPSTKGFGYAVFEGHKMLVHWGVKSVKGDKNAGAIEKVEDVIARYNPQVMVLEDTATTLGPVVGLEALEGFGGVVEGVVNALATEKQTVALF